MIIIKTRKEIEKILISCRMVALVLSELKKDIQPGITTKELNEKAEYITARFGAIPGFKGYKGFPYSICASVNDQVVHGFPNNTPLKEGDVLSIDFGILYKGWYGDAAFTKAVGKVNNNIEKLIKTTEACLYKGIEQAVPMNRIGDISAAIESNAASNGFEVVREYVGHGLGRELHEEPQIPNFGNPGEGYIIKPGMVIAIEPMLTEKSGETKTLKDGWTTKTVDGGLSAHFEHTIAIFDQGPKILTMLED
jgi:methionyl aminopeptidase